MGAGKALGKGLRWLWDAMTDVDKVAKATADVRKNAEHLYGKNRKAGEAGGIQRQIDNFRNNEVNPARQKAMDELTKEGGLKHNRAYLKNLDDTTLTTLFTNLNNSTSPTAKQNALEGILNYLAPNLKGMSTVDKANEVYKWIYGTDITSLPSSRGVLDLKTAIQAFNDGKRGPTLLNGRIQAIRDAAQRDIDTAKLSFTDATKLYKDKRQTLDNLLAKREAAKQLLKDSNQNLRDVRQAAFNKRLGLGTSAALVPGLYYGVPAAKDLFNLAVSKLWGQPNDQPATQPVAAQPAQEQVSPEQEVVPTYQDPQYYHYGSYYTPEGIEPVESKPVPNQSFGQRINEAVSSLNANANSAPVVESPVVQPKSTPVVPHITSNPVIPLNEKLADADYREALNKAAHQAMARSYFRSLNMTPEQAIRSGKLSPEQYRVYMEMGGI